MEGLYYVCCENKGTDQLRGYCAADLRLCLRICKSQDFSCPVTWIDSFQIGIRIVYMNHCKTKQNLGFSPCED